MSLENKEANIELAPTNPDEKREATVVDVPSADDKLPELRQSVNYVLKGSLSASDTRMLLSWKDVGFTVQVDKDKTKTILSKITGYVAPGETVAILGASGM